MGKGKLEEIRDIIEEDDIDAVVCDDELSPAQLRNLNEYLDIKVLDRTIMILEDVYKRQNFKFDIIFDTDG